MQPKALPGFRDFYPDELALRAYIFRVWREVATRYGFEEYDGPPLEPLELYTAKSGDEIVGQLYHFTDKGDRQVALRPEMTPTLARMVAARANGLKKPIRWFSIPQLFRYERQQRGRLREHFQLNCDLIGEAGPLADAEIIALAVDVMRAFRLGPADVRVRLSDRRMLNALLSEIGLADAQYPLAYQLLDKLGRGEYEASKRALLDSGAAEGTVRRLEAVRGVTDWATLERDYPAAASSGDALRQAIAALGAMGLGEFVDLDLTIVRGLAYYTGTVFEIFDAGKTLRAICGGGRYDNLVGAIGGVDLPCVGFGLGDVVLGDLLKNRELLPERAPSVDVFVAAITADDVPHVLQLAHELRDAGLRVEYTLSPQAPGKQLALADARRARVAVVIGPDDRARGEVALKDLAQKAQRGVPRERIRDELQRLLGGGA